MTADHSTLPVAVVGAGFSGTMTALHLLPRLGSRTILLCERGDHFARGVAYGTGHPGHLLNVRAANMSAYPDRPDHFLDWLARAPAPDAVRVTAAGTFVSRHLYGRYLTDLLSEAVAGRDGASRLILVPDEVVDLVPAAAGYRLVLAGGAEHRIAAAVLAAGNLLPAHNEPGPYVANPWLGDFTQALRGREPVVVVGSGLTMVDVTLQLLQAGFEGPVVAISRRGLRPHVHAATMPWPTPALTARERGSPARLLGRLRREVAAAAVAGANWHSVVDSLRPLTSGLWRSFGPAGQDRFLRHARPWWDIHRHRMAIPVGERIAALTAAGTLDVRAGHVVDIAVAGEAAQVTYRPRGQAATATVTAQRVINASGAGAPDRAWNLLFERLIARGLVRPDPRGLGLDLDDSLAAVGASGAAAAGLWALGPLAVGAVWECIAVPDIRLQALRVAERVAETLAGAPRPGS